MLTLIVQLKLMLFVVVNKLMKSSPFEINEYSVQMFSLLFVLHVVFLHFYALLVNIVVHFCFNRLVFAEAFLWKVIYTVWESFYILCQF